MEKDKVRSFRISPLKFKKPTGFDDMSQKDWWKFRKMGREEFRNTAGVCLLLGFLMQPFFLIGIISGIIWIYKVIRKQE